MVKKLLITLVRSPLGRKPAHRRTLRALGLHKIGQTVEQDDVPQVRGMVRAVDYLVKVEEGK